MSFHTVTDSASPPDVFGRAVGRTQRLQCATNGRRVGSAVRLSVFLGFGELGLIDLQQRLQDRWKRWRP